MSTTQLLVDLAGLLPLGDKRKLLNQFIYRSKQSEVDTILRDCKGLPYSQYNLLKVLLADKFHRFDLIIELLYKGDSDIISKVVCQPWLYEPTNSLITDCEFLLNELFPNVSYHCRQKVLYRIGRYVQNEEQVDKIWNAVEQRYGFNVAFPLLQACSKVTITSVISNRSVDLSGYQLVHILQKYPEVGLDYLKNHFNSVANSSSTNTYRSPLPYLFKNRPDDFLDLCINHANQINCFKMGRGRSTKMIRTYRSKLLEHPVETSSLLKLDRIRREFRNEEFQMLFESSLPKEHGFINYFNVCKWVNTVPLNKRTQMMNQAFIKLFQIDLDEHPELMSPEYITLLPDEKRMSVVQWKIDNDNNYGWSFNNVYAYYYTPEEKKRAWLLLKPISHSVPELQKLLLIEQDVNTRALLSKYLIETCYINEDLPQLLNVLKLLSNRSRNDQPEVRNQIFVTLSNIMVKMKFTKEHWDNIIEMIQVALVFKDNKDYSDGEKEKLVEKCIAFHLASKLPLNNLVSMHIKLKIQISASSWTNSHITNATDRRILLESYVKELKNLQLANNLRSFHGLSMENKKLSEFIADLIQEICKFNNNDAKASQDLKPILISSHEWLRTKLEQSVKEEEDRVNNDCSNTNSRQSWNFSKKLVNIIKALRKEQNQSLDGYGLEILFSKILYHTPCNSILMHFLSKNPSHLTQSWSSTLRQMLKNQSSSEFMRKLKLWNYSLLIAESIKICTEVINQTKALDSAVTINQKCNAVLVNSILSEPAEAVALAAKFFPTEAKVDVFAENSEDDYQIRQTFAKSLVNVTVPHLTFAAIEKFCFGDYLKIAIGAFYSQTGRASQTESLNFLHQKLLTTPVSLQKQIIHQYFTISNVEDKIRALHEIESSNVRHETFLQANNLFRSSPFEETWSILKTIIEKTSVSDAAIVKYLHLTPNLNTCPQAYICNYIETCLAALRRVEPGKIENFVAHLTTIIDKIPENTLDDIILHKVAGENSLNSSFCVKYVYSSSTTSILEHRLSNIWSSLQDPIRNGWDRKIPRQYEVNSFEYPTRSLIFSLIFSLCVEEINDSSKSWMKKQIFQTLLGKFKAESVTKFFKEILYLELAFLFVDVVELKGIERLRSFGRILARFIDFLAGTYGCETICIVKNTVNDFLQHCFSDEFNKNMGVIVELIDEMLETSKTRQIQLISIALLKNVNPKAGHLVTTLEKINAFLKESSDVVTQIYYGSSVN